MADRVKYFLLGLLFLVVAGVIAFDRWNSREPMSPDESSASAEDSEGEIWIRPPNRNVDDGGAGENREQPDPGPLHIKPNGDGSGGARAGGSPNAGRVPEIEFPPLGGTEPKPQPKPAPKPKPTPPAKSDTFHVVRSGETLGEIAQQYYPGRVQSGIRLIVEANRISNPNVIRADTRLVIPSSNVRRSSRKPVVAGSDSPAKKPASNSSASSGGIPGTYKVKSGDGDLYAILRKFYGRQGEGARIVRVMEMNDLISTRVKTGTVLRLPPK
jgi:LysM repeat protein